MKNLKIYNILEIANVHAGNFDYLLKLIDEYAPFTPNFGIKFQPFRFDRIALSDYNWYKVYEELYFTEDQWKKIILKAKATKDIWIDVFDDYSFTIAKENLSSVYGFKFQASTLHNKNLLKLFSTLDLREKKIILNISGLSISVIQEVLEEFTTQLNPQEIILQIGFQAYPTHLKDSGLSKIDVLKSHFKNKICFADHIAADHEDAKTLPVIASLKGVEYIEKHICLSGEKPKYDHYSSLDFNNYQAYYSLLGNYQETLSQPFINSNEANYLKTTLQVPIAGKDISKGSILDLRNDLEFRRTNQKGLSVNEIESYMRSFHILANDKKSKDTFVAEDFRKAHIGTVIACRMKSSRLPKKATCKIGSLSSVELCIKSSLSFKNVTTTILATSDLEDDDILKDYTYNSNVKFFQGHPEDVMKRVLNAVDLYGIDVFIRITADMPYVSNDILEILLNSHFKSGADYTRANHAAIGTNLEIINVAALRRAKSYFPEANYSEYMTYYFTNNPEYFKLNFVDLPLDLVRDYRLTLDYPEDLQLFNIIQEHLDKNNLGASLKEIFKFLDENPDIATINKDLQVKYHSDPDLIAKLNKFTKIS